MCRQLTAFRDFVPSIVPVAALQERPDIRLSLLRRKVPHVPQLQRLILRVRQQIPSVILRVDVGDAIDVSEQQSRRFRVVLVETPTIPHPNARVVTARVEEMRRLVDKSNAIHVRHDVVLSHRHPQRPLISVPVKDVDTGVGPTADNLVAVVRKRERKSAEPVDVRVEVETSDVVVVAVERADVETLGPRRVREIL